MPTSNASLSRGSAESQARSLVVRGIVQGVGFRPFVYRLANWVCVAGCEMVPTE